MTSWLAVRRVSLDARSIISHYPGCTRSVFFTIFSMESVMVFFCCWHPRDIQEHPRNMFPVIKICRHCIRSVGFSSFPYDHGKARWILDSMVNSWIWADPNHESGAIGPATDRWHSRKNRGHHGTPAVDRGVHRDVTVQIIQQKQGDGGGARLGNFSRHDRVLICCSGGSVTVGKRTLAWEGIQDASGVRENAAGRRNEKRLSSTPRTIRGRVRAKRRSPSGV